MTNEQFEAKMKADLEESRKAGNTEAASTLQTALTLWNKLTGPERRRFRRHYQRRKASLS